MHMVFTVLPLTRAVFARSIKKLGWQPRVSKSREHDFPKKNVLFFEIPQTSDTYLCYVALRNHEYGLSGIYTSQSGVYKVK